MNIQNHKWPDGTVAICFLLFHLLGCSRDRPDAFDSKESREYGPVTASVISENDQVACKLVVQTINIGRSDNVSVRVTLVNEGTRRLAFIDPYNLPNDVRLTKLDGTELPFISFGAPPLQPPGLGPVGVTYLEAEKSYHWDLEIPKLFDVASGGAFLLEVAQPVSYASGQNAMSLTITLKGIPVVIAKRRDD